MFTQLWHVEKCLIMILICIQFMTNELDHLLNFSLEFILYLPWNKCLCLFHIFHDLVLKVFYIDCTYHLLRVFLLILFMMSFNGQFLIITCLYLSIFSSWFPLCASFEVLHYPDITRAFLCIVLKISCVFHLEFHLTWNWCVCFDSEGKQIPLQQSLWKPVATQPPLYVSSLPQPQLGLKETWRKEG